jgi:hypothetical protein
VQFVTITDFRRAASATPTYVEASGKLDMGVNEIAKVPDAPGDEDYAGGIKIVVTGGY